MPTRRQRGVSLLMPKARHLTVPPHQHAFATLLAPIDRLPRVWRLVLLSPGEWCTNGAWCVTVYKCPLSVLGQQFLFVRVLHLCLCVWLLLFPLHLLCSQLRRVHQEEIILAQQDSELRFKPQIKPFQFRQGRGSFLEEVQRDLLKRQVCDFVDECNV